MSDRSTEQSKSALKEEGPHSGHARRERNPAREKGENPMDTEPKVETPQVVWVLLIHGTEGRDISAHVSEESAFRALHDYVKDRWIWDEPIPDDPDDAIDQYFEDASGEAYEIKECIVAAS